MEQVEVTQADIDRVCDYLDHDDPRWWRIKTRRGDSDPLVQAFARHRIAALESLASDGRVVVDRVVVLNDIAVMMSEFVDNWPNPKKISTALALIAKTIRTLLDPPKHQFWGAGEPNCPSDIRAANGELWKLRCKVCGQDNPRDDRCLASIAGPGGDAAPGEGDGG